jgi:hypothetical protein
MSEPRLAVNNDLGPGPPHRTKDWVTPLSVGTRFLCMDKVTKGILALEILARSPKGYVCLIDTGDDSIVWHDPTMFCHQKDFLDLLGEYHGNCD